MSDNQTKRFHRLISEGRIVFKAAAYTQSEDGEHPEHITFKLDFSSSDGVAVLARDVAGRQHRKYAALGLLRCRHEGCRAIRA